MSDPLLCLLIVVCTAIACGYAGFLFGYYAGYADGTRRDSK